MKYFMNWCCEYEKVQHFYETSVFQKLEVASLDLRNACEHMYLHACGMDNDDDNYSYEQMVNYNMKYVKCDLTPVWDWYGYYRNWCEKEKVEWQTLDSIAQDSRFLGYPYAALEYVFMIMYGMFVEMDGNV